MEEGVICEEVEGNWGGGVEYRFGIENMREVIVFDIYIELLVREYRGMVYMESWGNKFVGIKSWCFDFGSWRFCLLVVKMIFIWEGEVFILLENNEIILMR